MIIGISSWVRSYIVMVARIATIRPGARGRVPPGPALSSIRRSNILMINIMTARYLSKKYNRTIHKNRKKLKLTRRQSNQNPNKDGKLFTQIYIKITRLLSCKSDYERFEKTIQFIELRII